MYLNKIAYYKTNLVFTPLSINSKRAEGMQKSNFKTLLRLAHKRSNTPSPPIP